MLSKKINLGLLFILSLISCSKEIDELIVVSSEKSIISFEILKVDNPTIEEDIIGTIDEENNEINLDIDENIDITSLYPLIKISENALITPANLIPQDFSKQITYEVTANDNSVKNYQIKTKLLSNNKSIEYFGFLKSDNDFLTSSEFIGTINEENKIINIKLPFGTPLTNLQPEIRLSNGASLDPLSTIPQDFSAPVKYTVMASNGTKAIYTINIQQPELSEKDALIAIYNANPGNFLGWDLTSDDIESWRGVDLRDGKVTSLSLFAPRGGSLRILPPEIKNLVFLESLSLHSIKDVSLELFSVTTLKSLQTIATLPIELGNLINLEVLSFGSVNSVAELNKLPPTIKNLKNLKHLDLNTNLFTEIPQEIFTLQNLEVLILTNNSIDKIPTQIKELKNLTDFSIQANKLVSIPEEISSLDKLEVLNLSANTIEALPASLGELRSLKTLDIRSNNFQKIPQEICNLENTGTTINKDDTVVCD